MEIETTLGENCIHILTSHITSISPPPLKALASARALIINPSTSNETVSRILETLVQFLQHREEFIHHHVLKLLSDIPVHRNLSLVIVDRIYAYVLSRKDNADCLTANALSVIITVTKHGSDEELGCFFYLLCSSPDVSVRTWIISNADKFRIPRSALVKALLNFRSDLYPYVRKAALEGLISLGELRNVETCEVIRKCYDWAVELLGDTKECVRTVAIRGVSQWGNMLGEDWSDGVFVQICSMVRDMDVEVRVEAFEAIGNTKFVSEDILLQTLSKKVAKNLKERKITILSISNAAGVFVHGLEDEYYEVRKSACMCLGKLIGLSVKFAEDVLHLLIDMLNDDRMAVRLECLQTMYRMAICERLKIKEAYWHMFLGALVDSSTMIRCAARKILRLMKVTNRGIYKTIQEDLLTNLSSYPEDEADIFSVLFHIGRNHVDYTVKFVMGVLKEVEPTRVGVLHFDNTRVPAILVLAIAASLAYDQHSCGIPVKIFQYAVPFLGRISHAIRDVISQETLFSYLSHRSNFMHSTVYEDILIPNDDENINKVNPLRQICYGSSENTYQQRLTFGKKEEIDAIGIVLRTVTGIWPFIKSGCIGEVHRTLSSCKEELATISAESTGSVGLIAFACQYVKVIQLLGKVWQNLFPPRMFHGMKTGLLDLSLEKLEMSLRKLRYGFLGFSLEIELHILDFVLLTCVLKLSNSQIFCQVPALKKLVSSLSYVENSCEKGSVELSDFAKEVKLFCQEKSSHTEASYYLFYVRRLSECFSLKQIMLDMELKQITADLTVPGNDSENPFPFILGFPAAITFRITLQNVCSQDKLWLRMAFEETTEYVFLDYSQFQDDDYIRKLTLSLPFCRTPKVASFSLRACIGKECPSNDIQLAKGLGGPKGELIFLCKEKEVYFVRRS